MVSNGQPLRVALKEQDTKNAKMLNLLSKQIEDSLGLETEQKIVFLTNQIDDEVTKLDNTMDVVLEQHERDFLTAYRKHMIEVQQELNQLKAKGTDAEL